MEVIQFGKTLQKLSLSCQTFRCRSNKMNPDRTCNRSSWTKEEDKTFEIALAVYSANSDRFRNIAAVIPGKSEEEVIEHYNVLVEDINDIESGKVPLPKYERTQSSSSCRSRLSRTVVARRKAVLWTAEEHRLFLEGLAELGKGDWRGISRNFVFSRTPTQVASHAQKFYKRLHGNDNSKKKRSIHDIAGGCAAGITEPSQGQKSDKLTGPCGGLLQWPITDYVTDAFDTGMLSVPGPVTNCTTDSTEGPSAVNPEKSLLDAALGSELNSSFPGVDEFLQSVKDLITVPGQGTSGVCRGVDTRTSPSLNLQPTVAGGTRMYTHPVTVPAEGPSGVRHRVDTRTSPSLSLQSSVAGGTRMYTHPVTVPAESTSAARSGVDTRISLSRSLQPSIVGDTGKYTHTVTVPAEGTPGACREVDTRTSPSLSLQPSIVGGTGMYTHPVTVPAEGTSGARREVDTRTSPALSLQQSVVGGTGMYTHSVTVPAECTSGTSHGIDARISPSLNLQPSFVGGTGMYTHPVTVLAEGTSAACRGVDTRISPSLSLQPPVGGGTGMYAHPVTQLADGSSGARHGVGTRTSPSLNLQPSVVAGTGKYIHPVSVLTEGTSGARCGVDTSTAPSFNLQPSVGGGTGTYTHPVNNVGYDLEELMTLIGPSQVGPTVNTASFQLPIADHTGFHGCTASSSGTKNDFASTKGALEGVFSVNTMQCPSIPGSSGGGTYPCWYPSSNGDDICDLEDLFSDHMVLATENPSYRHDNRTIH